MFARIRWRYAGGIVQPPPAPRLCFDAFASYGPYPRKPAPARWTLEHLLQDMDQAGLAGALVTYAQALHYDPMLSNLRMIEQIRGHRDRLWPCWVALPSVSGEFPEPAELVAAMHEYDVRAVRVEPEHFGLPLDEALWRPLCQALAEAGVLVVTAMARGRAWDDVARLVELFAGNPVLLANHNWSQWRHVAALMQRCGNLHIEFSAFQANRAVEHFASRFGPERCLFGTGLPERAAGCARGMIDWSLLGEREVDMIAGGNLKRLLGGGPAKAIAPAGAHDDAIVAAASAGRPLPCPVLDAHCHILHEGGHTGGGRYVMLDGGPAGMLELARRIGVDRTAVMSWAGPLSMDTALGNQHVEEAVTRHPEHYIGLSTINPDHDSDEQIEAIIDRYHRQKRWPGLKTFTYHQTRKYDDPAFARYFGYGNEHGLYAVIDPATLPGDDHVERLAARYPNLGIHLDHCGQSWPYAQWAMHLARQFPNVWLQLNHTAATNGVIEYLVEQVGAERVLWGTDAPMRDPRPQVAWLAYTSLSPAQKAMVFGRNFAQILQTIGIDVGLQPQAAGGLEADS